MTETLLWKLCWLCHYLPLQENSISVDYVTEKLYDAFAGGCVPVYYGAPNILDSLPDPEAIIDYTK